MGKFLFTAVNRAGVLVTERIDSATVSAALYKLETRGYSNIAFQTDDLSQTIDAGIAASLPSREEEDDDEIWSAEEEVASRRGLGFWGGLWFAWRMNAILWVPLAVWDGFIWWEGAPFSIWDWIGFGFNGLFLLYFASTVLGIDRRA